MNIEIEQLADQQVIFMRRVGAYGPENFKLMNALKQWADEKGLLRNSVIYGVAQDNLDTPPEKCRYDVCLAAPEDCALDGAVQKGELPGGKYAVFTIAHTTKEVETFWASFGQRLKENDLRLDTSRPILERYPYSAVERGMFEFCVPIV